jgi:hypothetical protein
MDDTAIYTTFYTKYKSIETWNDTLLMYHNCELKQVSEVIKISVSYLYIV